MKTKISSIGIIIGGILVVVIGFLVSSSRVASSPRLRLKIDPQCDSLVGDLCEDIKAGLGLDVLTHEIFWEKEPESTWHIASLTKLMVVLIAMEKVKSGKLGLGDTIEVTAEASRMGGAQVYLKEGERFPLRELLEATLVYSANDASYLIGEYIGGSKEKFVQMMNKRAEKMGLRSTRFWNMTGLPPSEDKESYNVSTCRDMAILALEVIKYPTARRLASIKIDSFRNGEFELVSRNTLMRRCDLVDGLKTGYYRKAGWNIVATSLMREKKVIVIILGAKSRVARDSIAKRLIKHTLNKSSEMKSG
ncbi:D-alanyl-D-alanine carboxypeptidase [candidate division WOR-3 bacterium]|nr:D-alanyl-D-alanine carboxypeptidase [candidate division WOR-3 bacterium]